MLRDDSSVRLKLLCPLALGMLAPIFCRGREWLQYIRSFSIHGMVSGWCITAKITEKPFTDSA